LEQETSLPVRNSDAEAAISAEQIDDVVKQLNNVCRTSSLEFALRIGALVIHHLYRGDTAAWRRRGPKLYSFRRLAEHADLALSAGALCRCVAVFELCDRLNAASRWRRLGASHLRAVLDVPSAEQERLLERANDERWSVLDLRVRAQKLRTNKPRGGRRCQSALRKQIRALDRCLTNCSSALDIDRVVDIHDLNQGTQALAKTRAAVDELERALERQKCRLSSAAE
jgi:hypothetical protein